MSIEHGTMRIDGIGKVGAGSYSKIRIDGVGKIEGDLDFEDMRVNGTCKTQGELRGDYLSVDGVMTCQDVKVRQLVIDGLMKSEGRKVYADTIRVDGILKNDGEVNADRVEINGCASLNDLFGDEITINYGYGHVHVFTFRSFRPEKMNTAHNIECSKLEACNITCHSISATDITLSAHCKVDVISCNGVLRYDSTCRIGKIDGDCEKIVE